MGFEVIFFIVVGFVAILFPLSFFVRNLFTPSPAKKYSIISIHNIVFIYSYLLNSLMMNVYYYLMVFVLYVLLANAKHVSVKRNMGQQ